MLKPYILNIVLFWLVKYIFFYLALMFKNPNYAFINFDNINNGQDLFYYLWLLLFMPVVCMVIFIAPVYSSFKTKNINTSFLLLLVVLLAEYFIYTYLVSPADLGNGILNTIISVLVFVTFFYKHLPAVTTQK